MSVALSCLVLFTMSCCFGWCTRKARRQCAQSGRTVESVATANHVTWFPR